jgi:hypothetical protein
MLLEITLLIAVAGVSVLPLIWANGPRRLGYFYRGQFKHRANDCFPHFAGFSDKGGHDGRYAVAAIVVVLISVFLRCDGENRELAGLSTRSSP